MIEEKLCKGLEQLKSEVIDPGRCVSCGACVDLCPYIKAVGDRVAVTHSCGLTDGNCYRVCPRTYTDYDLLSMTFSGNRPEAALGAYRRLYHARASESAFGKAGQYGGVASVLAALLLQEEECDAALVTGSDGFYPRALLARTKEEVLAAAGSKYGVCPGLAVLNRSLSRSRERLAAVGRPCQVVALRKMQLYSSVKNRDRVGPLLGLLCFWGLDYNFYRFLKERGIARIFKADIPKDAGLTVETDTGPLALTLEQTRAFIKPGCYSCADPTAELADLSIGSTETDAAWCTLIVRTGAGEALVEKAVAAGKLLLKECPDEAAGALRKASLTKKRRVLQAEAEGDGPSVYRDYLVLAEEIRAKILGEGEQ